MGNDLITSIETITPGVCRPNSKLAYLATTGNMDNIKKEFARREYKYHHILDAIGNAYYHNHIDATVFLLGCQPYGGAVSLYHHAIANYNHAMAMALMQVRPKTYDGVFGDLCIACHIGSRYWIDTLILQGADVNGSDPLGFTPCQVAQGADIMDYLVSKHNAIPHDNLINFHTS
jgi:hypothetical protein